MTRAALARAFAAQFRPGIAIIDEFGRQQFFVYDGERFVPLDDFTLALNGSKPP